jgi:hypothetical protein
MRLNQGRGEEEGAKRERERERERERGRGRGCEDRRCLSPSGLIGSTDGVR